MRLTTLLSVLLLGLVGCSTTYNSYYEAREACKEWRSKEDVKNFTIEKKTGQRFCRDEAETNQILGLENVWNGKRDSRGWVEIDYEVKKNFRY